MSEARSITIQPEPMPPAPAQPVTPMAMLANAVASGASVEVVERLLTLQERYQAAEARRAFEAALADAKAEIPVIVKNREVDYNNKNNGRTNYRHEDLAGIAKVVDPILARHGLSYRYRIAQDAGVVRVTCIIAHRDGHGEETTLAAGHDTSGSKNSIQAIGSTVTYLQRYTLKAALGLAASNDDDGRAAGDPDEAALINAEQRERLQALIDETQSDIALFCKAFHVDSLAALPAAAYSRAVDRLLLKKSRMAAGSGAPA